MNNTIGINDFFDTRRHVLRLDTRDECILKVRILNHLYQEVSSFEWNDTEIDLGDQKDGFYLIELYNAEDEMIKSISVFKE